MLSEQQAKTSLNSVHTAHWQTIQNINKKQKTRLQLTAYFDRNVRMRNTNVFCISFVNVNSLQQALVLNYVVQHKHKVDSSLELIDING